MQDFTLFDEQGRRKYLTREERQRFYEAIPKALEREEAPFAHMLYWTGCRISEALGVQFDYVDYSAECIRFKTLKRRKTVYRNVPVPPHFMTKLDDVYNTRKMQKSNTKKVRKAKIWDYSRQWGYKQIKKVMAVAEISGVQATPKGLRHSFVITHQQSKTPAHMIQKWAGWSTPAMLQVYGAAMGEEEKKLAAAIW